MPNNVRLTYFNLRARGEPCRLLLAYGGVKYEDTRIPYPPDVQWTRMKPKTDFGQLPILNWDGVEICQSMACARFIAREVGLAGKNSMEQAQVDEIVDIIQDLYNAWLKFFLAKDQAALKNFHDVTLPTNLGMLEKKLISRGGQLILCVHYEYYLTSASFVSGLTGLELIKCYVDSLGENAAKSAVSISDGLILILYVCNNVRYLWMSWG